MKRSLAIVAAILFVLWLASIGVILFYVAGLAGVPLLLAAVVCQIAVFLVASALLLVTNTHDAPAAVNRAADPFSMTSEDLKNAVLLADNMPYGRRKHDDTQVVKRLIGKFEDEDALRPAPPSTPQWALDLQQHASAADVFSDAPVAQEES